MKNLVEMIMIKIMKAIIISINDNEFANKLLLYSLSSIPCKAPEIRVIMLYNKFKLHYIIS